MQCNYIVLGKSSELYKVKQQKKNEIVIVANKSAEESIKVYQSSFSSLAAARDKPGKCVKIKDEKLKRAGK